MDRDTALTKIKKCLALAKSSNEHEAAAAMRQAQKLMVEHNLTEADAALSDVSQVAQKTAMKTMTPWESSLARAVADAFECDLVWSTSRKLSRSLRVVSERSVIFVGVGAAPEVAGYAFDVLSRQCSRGRAAHIARQPKACKTITKTARGDEYAMGWVMAVRDLLAAFAGSEANTLLIEKYIEINFPNTTTVKPKDRAKGRNVSNNDFFQGHHAGKSAELNRGVGGVPERGLLA
ncbi:hypothetical protein B0E41_25595 [Hydrogenophaga sp. A37]|nr:hypothetical protein B0E41_25595 [Hydrogenophaga sp. A37]